MSGGIAAVLLGLASGGHAQETLEPASEIRVQVKDRSGVPPADGVLVQLVLAPRPAADGGARLRDRMGPREVARARTDESGVAAFSLEDVRVPGPEDNEQLAVQLAIPPSARHRVILDASALARGEVSVQLPEYGKVIFEFSAGTEGSVSLRAAASGQGRRHWFSDAHAEAMIESGSAVFPHIGLGIELEYQCHYGRGVPPVSGRLRGPKLAGEVVHHRPRELDSFPAVVGRILTEMGKPIVEADISVSVNVHTSGSGSSRGLGVRTDAEGRFRLSIVEELPPGAQRLLHFRDASALESRSGSGASRLVDLSRALDPSEHDLGDIVLVSPGAELYLLGLGDRALQEYYEECIGFARINGAHVHLVESCLIEMSRRGSDHWQAFLESAWTERNEHGDRWRAAPGGVEFLTALRRAQGRPDPLAIEIADASQLHTRFPRMPRVEGRIVHRDTETLLVTEGGDYRSGRFARCRVEGLGDSASEVRASGPRLVAGGLFITRELSAGDSMPVTLPLEDFVEFPGPGTYTLHVLYHNSDGIADSSAIGRVVSRSPPFEVTIDPLTIESEHDSAVQRLRECGGGVGSESGPRSARSRPLAPQPTLPR